MLGIYVCSGHQSLYCSLWVLLGQQAGQLDADLGRPRVRGPVSQEGLQVHNGDLVLPSQCCSAARVERSRRGTLLAPGLVLDGGVAKQSLVQLSSQNQRVGVRQSPRCMGTQDHRAEEKR